MRRELFPQSGQQAPLNQDIARRELLPPWEEQAPLQETQKIEELDEFDFMEEQPELASTQGDPYQQVQHGLLDGFDSQDGGQT